MIHSKKTINGIDVIYLPAKKYKHLMLGFSYISKANPKTYNERNILLNVLENHNQVFKTDDKLYWQLDMLYGANFKSNVGITGDKVANNFSMKIINEKYLQNSEDLLEKAFDFLYTIVYKPKMHKGLLTKKAVNDSIKELGQVFNTIQQDKSTKAFYNFIDLVSDKDYPVLFPNKTYLDSITQGSITQEYKKMIQDDALKIFVAGDFDHQRMDDLITSKFKGYHKKIDNHIYKMDRLCPMPFEVRDIVEYDKEVSVSRIYLAYRINVNYGTHDYEVLQLLNIILGGSSQSKLFSEIREKQQLVYSIYSSYFHELSILLINLETEANSEEKAIQETQKVLSRIQEGHISEEEIDLAKAYLIKNYRSSLDKLSGMMFLNMISHLKNKEFFNLNKQIEAINKINKNDLVRISKKLMPDLVYRFLKAGDLNA